MSETLVRQVRDHERRIAALEAELAALREPKAATQTRPHSAPPPRPAAPPRQPRPAPEPRLTEPWDASSLLNGRTLALVGAAVSLLGIAFLFVLAVDRGWIGPVARVALGATASALVFAAGVAVRRRSGSVDAALAAVGVGIAGGYGSLAAAVSLYHLFPLAPAGAIAAAVAAAGLTLSLRWRAQIVAGVGLIGALLMPALLALDDRPTAAGVAFSLLVFCAAGAAAARRRWWTLQAAATIALVPQVLAFVLARGVDETLAATLLAAAASAALVAVAVATHVAVGPRLRPVASTYAAAGATLGAVAAVRLYTDVPRGLALLIVAGAFAALAAATFGRQRVALLSPLAGALGLTLGAFAVAELLDGPALAYAWAVEAAALAWVARRVREPRYLPFAAGYWMLALGHVLLLDARPDQALFEHGGATIGGAAVAALVAAAAAVGARVHARVRPDALWAAAAVATYAASLAVLAIDSAAYAWAQVGVTAMWAAVGLALVTAARRSGLQVLRDGGLVWLGAAVVKAAAYDAGLAANARATAFVVLSALLLVAALVGQRRRLDPVPVALALAAIVLGTLGAAGFDAGYGLAVVAAVLIAVAATTARRVGRDFATLLWGPALVLAAASLALLLDQRELVLGWSAFAVAAAAVGARLREERLLVAAAGYGAGAGARDRLAGDPGRPVPRRRAPGKRGARVAGGARRRRGSGARRRGRRSARFAWWAAGVVTVHLASLALLELVQVVSDVATRTGFQRGHVVVSAFWGLLALALLSLGLARWRALRGAGFVLFALALAKIFLYDLAALSSVARASSFLAVGLVLLAAAYSYQRLAAGADTHARAPRGV